MTAPVIPWNVALIWRKDRQLPPATRAWLELAQRRLVAGPKPGARTGRRAGERGAADDAARTR
jgi:hypothetical protein